MTQPSSQQVAFAEEVARKGKAFTFTRRGEYLVLRSDDRDVIPFWSSRSKAELIQVFFSDYADCKILEMNLDEFISWLPEVQEQEIYIGANWSGKSLEGYEVAPETLIKTLNYWAGRLPEDQS